MTKSSISLLYPVNKNSIITQTFNEHLAAARKNGWKYYNGGIDWAVKMNTPIQASASGTVLVQDQGNSGYGKHVRIDHGAGYVSIYAHLSAFNVKNAQVVFAGDVIGYSGSTGNSTGPHLHFEVRLNGKAIDPASLLSSDVIVGADDDSVELGINKNSLIVICDVLNVRNGPGTEYSKVGELRMGDIIQPEKVYGQRVWIEFEPGKFVAMIYDRDRFLDGIE